MFTAGNPQSRKIMRSSHSETTTTSTAETKHAMPFDTPYMRFEHRCAEKRMNRFSQSAQNSAAPGIAANSKYKS